MDIGSTTSVLYGFPVAQGHASGGPAAEQSIPENKNVQIGSSVSVSPTKTILSGQGLSEEEKRQVQRLKQRDAEVRNHERAHVASGGPYVRGGANFEYQRGPDGKNYAVGGEVSIDVSKEPNPAATIRKMQVVRRAALAPADPSPQDRAVAAKATQIEAQARIEKRQSEQEEENKTKGGGAYATAVSMDQATQLNRQAAIDNYSRPGRKHSSGAIINLPG